MNTLSSTKRIMANTFAQYAKTIANIVLSMYSMRLVLELLGESDFGVYSVVAGTVTLLSFVSNALIVSTQRFLSYNQGSGDAGKLRTLFNDSVLLHLYIGLALLAVLAALTPLVTGFLDIPAGREEMARFVYLAVIAVVFVTFVTAPFRACLISHEDIVYISIIDVLDGVLKVVLVIVLSKMSVDSLGGYAVALLLIQLFNFLAFSVFALCRYDECSLPRIRRFSSGFIAEMSSFAGWTIYSTGCILGRSQGLSIILNKMLGVVANAAFGIAQSVSGFVHFISESLLNAMRPQIMKAEGAGDRERMLALSSKASKLSYLLLASVVVPVCFYCEPLLNLWLGDACPSDAVFFCRMVLVAGLVDTVTIGLGSANQAVGRIRNYSLVVNTTKLLSLPFIIAFLAAGFPLWTVALCYIGAELVCAVIRIPFLKATAGLAPGLYVSKVLLPLVFPTLVYLAAAYLACNVVRWGVIAGTASSFAMYAAVVLLFSLDEDERRFLSGLLKK